MSNESQAGTQGALRSREVRLGVVMFGGISLAVYINGVSQELFRAVRGRGVYRLLKALTDSHVVVDILSGASAGGINGVLLSTALCNGTEFGGTAELWRQHADIESLLSVGPGEPRLTNSILNGTYHQLQLELAFAPLLGRPQATIVEPEDPSPVGELDLFITGTDIDGQQRRFRDALGSEIALTDHRALFRLKHRVGRKTPFAPGASLDGSGDLGALAAPINIKALATVSHITSCFPGAFVPVKLTIPSQIPVGSAETLAAPQSAVDARLSYWGALKPFELPSGQLESRQAIFMDGGVLKNKPFTSTIEAIFSRLADRQVSRFMLYVDPDPIRERFVNPKHPEINDPARRLLPVALAAASGLPRFESIDGDLAQVELHNQQVRRYQTIVREATAAAMTDPAAATHTPTPVARAYRQARISGLAAAVAEAVSGKKPTVASSLPGDQPELGGLAGLIDRLGAFPGLDQLYSQLDVLFGFRRLIQLTYLVDDAAPVKLRERDQGLHFLVPSLTGGPPTQSCYVPRELLGAINRQIELYEVVRARLESELAACAGPEPLDWANESLWRALADRARSVLAQLPRPRCFEDDRTTSVTARELTALRLESSVAKDGFLAAAEAFERRLLAPEPTLLKLYDRFAQIDEVAYPLELVSQLRGRDLIRTVRISPLDAKVGFARGFTKKLCGGQLFDFGAFFQASWRANDLLWGRLDGVSQLLDILLDAERLAQLQPELLQANLTEVLGSEFDLSRVFPHLGEAERSRLQGWLCSIANADTAHAARSALHHGSDIRELWVRAAQLEILVEELPRVLQSAALEADDSATRAQLTAHAEAIESPSPLAAGNAAKAYFTPEKYDLATQSLPDAMPREQLRELLSQGGQHLKDALLQSLPPDGLWHAMVRAAAGATLSTALWVGTKLWLDGKEKH